MFKKILCALLCAVLLLSLCACNSVDIATYEGMTLDSSMYALHLAIEKRAIQEYLYYYYKMDISSTPAFWDEYYDQDNKITWTDYVQTEFCNMLVAMKFCKDHGISMSDESIAADIDELIQDYIKTARIFLIWSLPNTAQITICWSSISAAMSISILCRNISFPTEPLP